MTDPTSEPRRLTQLYIDVLNERRMQDYALAISEDLVSHLRVGDIAGLEAFKEIMEMTYEAFPGVIWEIDEVIVTADRAVIRYHFDAVQRGPFLGIPASHRMVHLEGVEVLHIREGRICEIWNYADIMGIAAQLRAIDPLDIEI